MRKTGATPPPTKISIPDVPPSPNRILGKHWSAKAGVKNKWILWIRSQYLPERACGLVAQRKRVEIMLHHSQLRDPDNLVASCKPVLDALKHWGLIWDDAPRYLELSVSQTQCQRRKDQRTEIEISEL